MYSYILSILYVNHHFQERITYKTAISLSVKLRIQLKTIDSFQRASHLENEIIILLSKCNVFSLHIWRHLKYVAFL